LLALVSLAVEAEVRSQTLLVDDCTSHKRRRGTVGWESDS